MSGIIELGGVPYKKAWFQNVTEEYAVAVLGPGDGKDRIRNVWKQANGKSVRNYSKSTKDKKDKK